MKSAYELAMERLNKTSAPKKLSEQTKKELAELDTLYSAKAAEKEIFLKGQMRAAAEKGDYEAYQNHEKQLSIDKKSLQAELEEKKEKIRGG